MSVPEPCWPRDAGRGTEPPRFFKIFRGVTKNAQLDSVFNSVLLYNMSELVKIDNVRVDGDKTDSSLPVPSVFRLYSSACPVTVCAI